jgi:hypothetical protein
MREGAHSKGPWWKRLLPWAFSIGLHLFLLPWVLVLTITFADQLFVPTEWNDLHAEALGDFPPSLLIEDMDFPIKEVGEKAFPVEQPKVASPSDSPGAPGLTESETSNDPSDDVRIEGTLIELSTRGLEDGILVVADEKTKMHLSGQLRFSPLTPGSIPLDTPVIVLAEFKYGSYLATYVFAGLLAQPKQRTSPQPRFPPQ